MRISIIGGGNVGSHLVRAFKDAGHNVSLHHARGFQRAALVDDNPDSKDPDVVLICVKDDVVATVASELSGYTGVVAHTSGSVSMSVLVDNCIYNAGVLYPLQTFSKDVEMRYDDIPFYVEGSSAYALKMLKELASTVSNDVNEAGSEDRKRLHIGAVFACNFSNHLLALAKQYLSDNNLDFKSLIPLIGQTLDKAKNSDPARMQTGPASRFDYDVMSEHERMLDEYPCMKKLYSELSESIMKTQKRSNPTKNVKNRL